MGSGARRRRQKTDSRRGSAGRQGDKEDHYHGRQRRTSSSAGKQQQQAARRQQEEVRRAVGRGRGRIRRLFRVKKQKNQTTARVVVPAWCDDATTARTIIQHQCR